MYKCLIFLIIYRASKQYRATSYFSPQPHYIVRYSLLIISVGSVGPVQLVQLVQYRPFK